MSADVTLGGIMLGTFICCFLYSIAILQGLIHLREPENERRKGTNLLVLCVLALDSVNTAFVLYSGYTITITNFGRLEATNTILWSQPAYNITTILLMGLVHVFFARRVWIVCNKSYFLTGMVLFFAFVHAVDGTSYAATIYRFDSWSRFESSRPTSFLVLVPGLASAAITDILIAVFLTFHLVREQRALRSSAMSSSPTQLVRVLDKLIVIIVSTGTLTAFSSAATLIAFFADHAGSIFLAVSMIGSKIYANTLLANLNSRKALSLHLKADDPVEFSWGDGGRASDIAGSR